MQACHCKLCQSSVQHNHNNKSKTSTTAPCQLIPTILATTLFPPQCASLWLHDCGIFTISIPLWCGSLWLHDCGIVMIAVPHCALTVFQFFTQLSPFPSLSHATVAPHHKNLPRHTPLWLHNGGIVRMATTVMELAFHTVHQAFLFVTQLSPFPVLF